MIIAISDRTLFQSDKGFKSHLIRLVDSDIDYLIIREKTMPDDFLQNLLLDIMASSKKPACQKIVVHTKEYIARQLGLTQIHRSEKDILVNQIKQLSYSYSIHADTPISAIPNNAKFILYSPVFETSCKPGRNLLIKENIKQLLMHTAVPVAALGGIDIDHIDALKEMGFQHVAMRSALMDESLFLDTIQAFKKAGFDG